MGRTSRVPTARPGARPAALHFASAATPACANCSDVLEQPAQGLGNREIARALFISEATVKTHLGRTYDKLGVDTRAGAVAVAKERRLLR